MTDEPNGSRPQRGLWNSPVLTALVTGMFGVLTAVIGYLAVLRDPDDGPASGPPMAIAAESALPPNGSIPNNRQTASVSPTDSQSAPNLLLNFAAFQARMASPGIQSHERDLIIRPLLHHQVIWKGYVDQITPVDQPTEDLVVMISLVETSEKTGQSMFKMPALCRFGPEAVEQLAALAPGDLVTITGTFSGHSLIGTNITAAQLMSVNGRPLSRMATGPTSDSIQR